MNTIEMILIDALERQYKLKRKRLAREGMQQRTKAEYQSLQAEEDIHQQGIFSET